MGNKSSRRRADAGGVVVNSSKADGKTSSSSSAAAAAAEARRADVQLVAVEASGDQKGVSCPDLAAGAVPYGGDAASSVTSAQPQQPRHLSYVIYRSTSNVADVSRRPEPRPDIR